MKHPLVPLMLLALTWLTLPARASEHDSVRNGDLEMHCIAIATRTLTPEAAKTFNVSPSPDRGLLTITVFRHLSTGETRTTPAQIFAGAVNQGNTLFNIPVREVRQGDAIYYLGEFRVNPTDSLRFLVNASAGGTPLTANFSRNFAAP